MNTLRAVFTLVITAALLGVAGAAYGVDGVVLIDQNRALAGNVTPGDAPGFPVTISQPGSYRLSGNLTVPNENTTAIVITANNVTVDLNGFAIIGPTVCGFVLAQPCTLTGTGRGIESDARSAIVVRNGTVRGMGNSGILHTGGTGHVVKHVHVESNGNSGMFLQGGTVSHNTALLNGLVGIELGHGEVNNNTASQNRSHGIVMSNGKVSHNTSMQNMGDGIQVSGGAAIYNTAAFNGGNGLNLTGFFPPGYMGNVMYSNTVAPVSGGVSLGGGNHNLCNGVPC